MAFLSRTAACLSNGLSVQRRRTIYFLGLAANWVPISNRSNSKKRDRNFRELA
jgi:hypothetical protein